MNIIWLIILISSTATMLFIDADGAIRAMLTGSTNAVNLALSLIATYGFWLGFFKLLESTGIAKIITRLLRPTIRFLFDNIDDETESLISMNMSANLLGLGNASTPVGISAMQKMDLHNGKTNTNMIMLVVISATSLQLIPSTVIGMRIFHGSLSPTAFLLPSIISTIFSTLVGILLVKIISSLTKKITAKSHPYNHKKRNGNA